MKKVVDFALWSLFGLFILLTIMRLVDVNRRIHEYENSYKAVVKELEIKFNLLGTEFDFNGYKNLSDDQQFEYNMGKERYILLLILSKLNCGQCLSKYLYNLCQVNESSVKIIVLGIKKEFLENKIRLYDIDYPILYTDEIKWFEHYGVEKGPFVLLINAETRKIVNVQYGLYFIDNIEKRYIDFIKEINR